MKLLLFLAIWITIWNAGYTLCPQKCSCKLDNYGRRTVKCTKGNLDTIPISEMDVGVAVIEISAPDTFPNNLTIGPIFNRFEYIEEIHIVRSSIPTIGVHTFWGLTRLDIINLTYNNIGAIVDSNFRGLANLKELHLDNNCIESIHSGVFQHASGLKVLTLSNNNITRLPPRTFLKLANLMRLDLSYNWIGELDVDVFKDIQRLQEFKCRKCGLTNVNQQLYYILSDLQYLDFGDNEIKYISSDELFHLKRLQRLNFDGNMFPVILDESFKLQNKLNVLNLSKNRLVKITDKAFWNLSSLMTLDISYNKLKIINPITFTPISDSLQCLKLSGNYVKVTDIKFILEMVTNLKALFMADMAIGDIPLTTFSHSEQITFLNISGNNLEYIDAKALAPLTRLTYLDISRNLFKTLDSRIVSKLEIVPKVLFHNNPFDCDDCKIVTLLKKVNKSADIAGINCAYPDEMAGKTLGYAYPVIFNRCTVNGLPIMESSLTWLTFGGKPSVGIIVLTILVIFFLVILIAFISFFVTSARYHACYYTNENKRTSQQEIDIQNQISRMCNSKALKNGRASIATIDEITRDVDMQIISNGVYKTLIVTGKDKANH